MKDVGIPTYQRVGRRNTYQIEANRPLRHPLDAHRNVNGLRELLWKLLLEGVQEPGR
ncbi:hypothetical protein [Deinococcus arenicola]|uniref:Uncharacterized protein n=1 Tax=Deinococcus arenicola TaxID=2994950 RepID=A0ABU4DQQ2_9DEIO|nr:hypothetical protein [Deinococcus sp. ZS9-10]MDV6374210.1 hypothetical protein [Deinococcus sp. ZS9-10]